MTHAPTSMAAGWGRLWRSWLCFVALCGLVSVATAQIPGKDFDHLRTGFALTGTHSKARCESCHLGGVFKGTPRDCETCHVSGSRFAKTNVVKNTGHIPTTQTCDTCHNTRAFTGARMDHAGIAKGACSTCHNGTQATGKPNGHPVTTAACDSCHSPSAWRPVSNFDHSGIAAGTCATCHNGSKATGMGPNHTPFTQVGAIAGTACDSCHKSGFRAWTPAKLHSGSHRHGPVRHLPHGPEAEQHRARRADRLRRLPPLHQQLVGHQGRPQQVQRRHRLRQLPQRHWRRHRQRATRTSRWAAPTAAPATRPRAGSPAAGTTPRSPSAPSARAATPATSRRPTARTPTTRPSPRWRRWRS
jgi:hypothetical protein